MQFQLIQNHVNHNCVNCAHFREQTESVGFLRNLYQTLSQLISQQVDTLEMVSQTRVAVAEVKANRLGCKQKCAVDTRGQGQVKMNSLDWKIIQNTFSYLTITVNTVNTDTCS